MANMRWNGINSMRLLLTERVRAQMHLRVYKSEIISREVKQKNIVILFVIKIINSITKKK